MAGNTVMNIVTIAVATNAAYTQSLQLSLLAVLVGGFLIAAIVGSIAWYNSKRPVGWENAKPPSWIPKIGSEKSSKSE